MASLPAATTTVTPSAMSACTAASRAGDSSPPMLMLATAGRPVVWSAMIQSRPAMTVDGVARRSRAAPSPKQAVHPWPLRRSPRRRCRRRGCRSRCSPRRPCRHRSPLPSRAGRDRRTRSAWCGCRSRRGRR